MPLANSTISPDMTPGQAVDARNAVADLEDAPDFADVDLGIVLLNFLSG